ncbi:hypothetical protein AOA80_06215 [Methanomassiliicoccales archaeon RumEn M1]|jgi:deoxyribonuclease V|nr:hypothetical protein AOA80_06215 [Methanomassiliicoccales archaeon RumEn M1]
MSGCATEIDLVGLIRQAASAIPEGMVATYGDIAKALGDSRAARAVGEVLSRRDLPPEVPTHRVVYSTGEVGRRDASETRRMLESEGVPFRNGRVMLEAARFSDFGIEPVLHRLRDEQESIADRVSLNDEPGEPDRIAGLDVSYQGDDAFAALCIMDRRSGRFVEERTSRCEARFPYIPTYLTYRELPALAPLVKDVPGTVYLMDGHGILHPRRAGVASHIGVALDVPTVGAAKTLLTGTVDSPEAERSRIRLEGEVAGCMLRQGRKAAYVSPGHRTTLRRAVRLCFESLQKGIPAPLRRAHELANQARKEAYP